jgi:O-antigen/teichoic acid export membrane protein
MLASWVSLEAAADWLVVSRVLSVFDVLVASPFFMAWGGLVHHMLRRPDAAKVASAVSRWTLMASTVAVLLMALAYAPLTELMYGQALPELGTLFVLLLWSKWAAVVKSPLCCGVNRSGDTGWALRNNLWALGIFVLSSIVLMHMLGSSFKKEGLAATMLIATVAQSLLLFHHSQDLITQRNIPMIWFAIGSTSFFIVNGSS